MENKEALFRTEEDFVGKDILSIDQFSPEGVKCLFALADKMRKHVEEKGGLDICKGKVMTGIFYEPSTRTSSSFQAAMLRLGGGVIPITDVQNSSVSKGSFTDQPSSPLVPVRSVVSVSNTAHFCSVEIWV